MRTRMYGGVGGANGQPSPYPDFRTQTCPSALLLVLVVCLNCRKAEFTIPRDELTLLAESHGPLGESLVTREPRAVINCPYRGGAT
jgi:hypothetical protein